MKRALIAVAALVLWVVAGCASEREQNLRGFQTMHDDLRKPAPAQPPKWQMNPGSEK